MRGFTSRTNMGIAKLVRFKQTALTTAGVILAMQPMLLGHASAAVQFDTLPVGATLPSDATCASLVRPTPEIASRGTINATYNARKGVGGNYLYPRVTGNYTGTTDEIIQWAACKWGMNEDLLRAQAVQESSWYQNAYGDFTTDGTMCTPKLPIADYPAQYNGDSAHNASCPESVGLLQVRWAYHKSAFFSSTTENNSTMTNNALYSTAYNVDYYGAVWRECFEGRMTWLNTVERGATYTGGNATGCQGVWFSGRWMTAPAISYINAVQANLANRTWETSGFAAQTSANPVLQPTTADSTAPTVNVTSPTTSQTVSGTTTISANASDNVAVSSVSFYLDGSTTALATDTSAPYSVNWSTTSVANGNHSLVAKAVDSSGNVGTSSTVTFTVSNVTSDTTAPNTSITSPRSGSTIRGTTTITATATDNIGVTRVEFLVDGVVKATDTTSPYSYSWNSGTVSRGTHTLRTRAYDAAGNSKLSASISVNVR